MSAIPSLSQPISELSRSRGSRIARLASLGTRRPQHLSQHLNPLLRRRAPSNIKSLRAHVYGEIKFRLAESGVLADDVDEGFFAWLLPTENASREDWDQFISNSMLVSDETLQTMFKLKEVLPGTSWDHGVTKFYIRSVRLSLVQFMDVLQAILESPYGRITQAYNWAEFVAKLIEDTLNTPYAQLLRQYEWEDLVSLIDQSTDYNLAIYVRYCGETTRSPWRRHKEDLQRSQTQGSFRSIFIDACRKLHPDLLENNISVYELSDARIPFPLNSANQRIADLREQALIATFGIPALLNTQIGGSVSRFTPHAIDDAQFDQLATNTVRGLEEHTSTPVAFQRVAHYAKAFQEYWNSLPAVTSGNKKPISNAMRGIIFRQAVAAQAHGRAIMATLGVWVTTITLEQGLTFYRGGGASANVMVDIINHLAKCELSPHVESLNRVYVMQEKNQLPFVDLYAWKDFLKKDTPPALLILRQYLLATRPIIVFTLGDITSVAAMANFRTDGIAEHRDRSIHAYAGEPFLSRYGDDPDADDDYYVIIPCYHPGIVANNPQEAELAMRVIHKTLCIVWVAMDEAVRLTQEPYSSAKALCQQVMKQTALKTGPATTFGKTFSSLKTEFASEIRRNTHAMSRARKAEKGEDQSAEASSVGGGSLQNKFQSRSLPYDIALTGQPHQKRVEALREYLPFVRGDAAWLINEFIAQQYPEGGEIDLADPVVWPECASMWTFLEAFLQQPRHQHHPQIQNLKQVVQYSMDRDLGGVGKAVRSSFVVLMHILRPPIVHKSVRGMKNRVARHKIVVTISKDLPPGVIDDESKPGEAIGSDLPRERRSLQDRLNDAAMLLS